MNSPAPGPRDPQAPAAPAPSLAVSPHSPPVRFPELPAVSGRVGPEPEDFLVDEVPLYAASGSGEHWYVHAEKRRLTTPDLVRRLARQTGVDERNIGYAGLKDKHAVTSQWLSLPGAARDPSQLDFGPEVKLLAVTRHQNKLRTGHLLGNRFTITLVGVNEAQDLERARQIGAGLVAHGLPNYFGVQRFGRGGRNVADAIAWLRRGGRGRGRFEQKLFPSVVQSELFNRYLSRRLALGVETLIAGEVVRLEGAGAMFRVEDPSVEQPRLTAGDLHLTGPMVGPKIRPASAAALELEQALAAELGLGEPELEVLGRFAPGVRRDLFAPLPDLQITSAEGGRLTLAFTLPAGGYATEVVRQLTHAPFLAASEEPAEEAVEA